MEKIYRGMPDGPEKIDGNFNELSGIINKKKTILWAGVSNLNENVTITFSKSINDCENGAVFIFCPYDNSKPTFSELNYFFVSKRHTQRSEISGHSVLFQMIRTGNPNFFEKNINLSPNKLWGKKVNNAKENWRMVLIEVVEF